SFQRPNIQLAAKPNRQRDRVAAAAALHPPQKPHPTLPIRQRPLARTPTPTQPPTPSSPLPQPLTHPPSRRRFEQAADRYLNTKARTKAADQARRQQRMATKRKKVVVNPNTLQSQYLGKQPTQ